MCEGESASRKRTRTIAWRVQPPWSQIPLTNCCHITISPLIVKKMGRSSCRTAPYSARSSDIFPHGCLKKSILTLALNIKDLDFIYKFKSILTFKLIHIRQFEILIQHILAPITPQVLHHLHSYIVAYHQKHQKGAKSDPNIPSILFPFYPYLWFIEIFALGFGNVRQLLLFLIKEMQVSISLEYDIGLVLHRE